MTLLAFISSALLTKVAIFGFAAVLAWWLLEFFVAAKPRAEQRLDEFREPNARRTDRDGKPIPRSLETLHGEVKDFDRWVDLPDRARIGLAGVVVLDFERIDRK